MTDEGLTTSEREAAEVSWSNVALGGAALLFCLPALFGCTGTFVPQLLYPGGSWPVETWWQRLMTGVYTWSVVLAMLSPPASVVGIVLGAWAIRRAGRRTAFGAALLWILLATFGLSLAFAAQILWMVKDRRPGQISDCAAHTGQSVGATVLPNNRLQLPKPAPWQVLGAVFAAEPCVGRTREERGR